MNLMALSISPRIPRVGSGRRPALTIELAEIALGSRLGDEDEGPSPTARKHVGLEWSRRRDDQGLTLATKVPLHFDDKVPYLCASINVLET